MHGWGLFPSSGMKRHGSHSQRNHPLGQCLSCVSLEVQSSLGFPLVPLQSLQFGAGQGEWGSSGGWAWHVGTHCAPLLSPPPHPLGLSRRQHQVFLQGSVGLCQPHNQQGGVWRGKRTWRCWGLIPKPLSCKASTLLQSPVQGQGGAQESPLSSWSTCPCGLGLGKLCTMDTSKCQPHLLGTLR